MRLPRRRVSLVVLLAVAAAGCGGGDGDAGGGEEGAGGDEPVATVEVVETDFEIDPMEAEVAESGPVQIDLSNEGQTVHSLEIEVPDREVVSETIEPGESTTFTADLPAGDHTWYCPVANHRELGMEGSITVGEAGGGTGGGNGGSGSSEEDSNGDSSEDEPSSGGSGAGY